jgi:hypothetical protein
MGPNPLQLALLELLQKKYRAVEEVVCIKKRRLLKNGLSTALRWRNKLLRLLMMKSLSMLVKYSFHRALNWMAISSKIPIL